MLSKLLNAKAIRSRIDASLGKRAGPSDDSRARHGAFLYAKVTHADGRFAEGWMETANGYSVTEHGAVSAVEQVLAKRPHGALAPSQAFGADFALGIPGTLRLDKPLR